MHLQARSVLSSALDLQLLVNATDFIYTLIVPAIAATDRECDRDCACMSRLDAYRGLDQHTMPHYPGAYLESKHCKIFAHWRTPTGVSFVAALFLYACHHSK